MATTPDKSGNSPVGKQTEAHIKTLLEQIKENTTPAP